MENVNKYRFTFKILSLGSFNFTLPDGKTVMNRPCVEFADTKKKWGNSYILFDASESYLVGNCFIGIFGIDRNEKRNIRLLENLNIPLPNPDYYVMTLSHTDPKIEMIKADNASFSQIFSNAFHYHDDINEYDCETVMLLRNGDLVRHSNFVHEFIAKTEMLKRK